MAEILAGHASGLNLGQVSVQMYLSYSCVTNTVQDIKKRLKARTLAQCVMKAHALGYLAHPDEMGRVAALDPHSEDAMLSQSFISDNP